MDTLSNTLHRALAYHQAGDLDAATHLYQQVLRIDPSHADALHLMGVTAQQTNHPRVAIDYIGRAIAVRPEAAEYHNNLAAALRADGRLPEAADSWRQALAINPLLGEAHYNLGITCRELGDDSTAAACYRHALSIDSHNAEAHNNLGIILKEQGQLAAARDCYDAALRICPDHAAVHNNLGIVLMDLRELDAARDHFEQALALDPDYADAHFNRALLWLLTEDFRRGWSEFEWRWRNQLSPRLFSQPRWNGNVSANETVFIYAEQGLGDEIMFASCIGDLVERNVNCLIECDGRLWPLLARSFPGMRFIARQDSGEGSPRPIAANNPPMPPARPQFDRQLPIGSLPSLFRGNAESFPTRGRYLNPDPQRLRKWQARYAKLGNGPVIGVSWRGGGTPETRRRRSISLDDWRALFALPDVQFVNLQYGDCRAEIAAAQARWGITLHDWPDANPVADLDDFAAQIAALDLVISADNSTVHLAGGVGTPVWVLLPMASDWRWGLHRTDSLWYPSVRLFRQGRQDDWSGVFTTVRRALETFAHTRG